MSIADLSRQCGTGNEQMDGLLGDRPNFDIRAKEIIDFYLQFGKGFGSGDQFMKVSRGLLENFGSSTYLVQLNSLQSVNMGCLTLTLKGHEVNLS